MTTNLQLSDDARVILIRSALILVTTNGSRVELPTWGAIKDHVVVASSVLTSNVSTGWVLIRNSTGIPPDCVFIPATRVQSSLSDEDSDQLAELLLSA